ncbi:MAG TPA: class II glutamine amidotransferase, partial [Exilispira sp.]|nr:class II glutamine amidotransferase [Exilispira sp.]
MCGVVSIIYGKENNKLGEEACQLLKRLEYRGYDSTGAAFINEEKNISLRKKVGSPSKVVEELQIAQFKGNRFIGQVRWATFGAVTDKNSQPHIVSCFKKLVGAHNGNIANTDSLKEFLTIGGHNVISDNDGEIIVHMIEHFYSLLLQKDFSSTDQLFQTFQHKDQTFQSSNEKKNSDAKNLNLKISKNIHLPEIVDDKKILTFIEAIRRADTKANGSYAACITDPDIEGIFAIKSGSSLYAGIGSDENGNFIVVSSDLTSVLSKTRFLIPL